MPFSVHLGERVVHEKCSISILKYACNLEYLSLRKIRRIRGLVFGYQRMLIGVINDE